MRATPLHPWGQHGIHHPSWVRSSTLNDQKEDEHPEKEVHPHPGGPKVMCSEAGRVNPLLQLSPQSMRAAGQCRYNPCETNATLGLMRMGRSEVGAHCIARPTTPPSHLVPL